MKHNNLRPLIPVSTDGLDAIAEALLRDHSSGESPDAPVLGHTRVVNPSSYIILEAPKGRPDAYEDLFVGMHRIGYESAMQRISAELGVALANTHTEQNGHQYIGSINWKQALKLNLKLGNKTLSIRQHHDLRELLADGIAGKRKVYDGTGKAIDIAKVTVIYNEIAEVRDPWRSEWLDAHFTVKNGLLHIESGHILKNNDLVPTVSEPLEDCVMKETWVDATSWNRQGLPTKKTRKHLLYYWPPKSGSVAWFGAVAGRAVLGCYGDQQYSSPLLGVRPARAKK